MMIILIENLFLLSIVTLVFSMIVLITSHVQIHCCISFDLMDQFSCLYIILIIFKHVVFITIHPNCHSLYVDMSDIFVLCLTVCCMSVLLCMIACRLSVWAVHLSPYLQPSGFGHFIHSGSHFCKCKALCVFVTMIELEIRSRV